MEGSVEDGDVRDIGLSRLRLADRAQRRVVVERRQRAELLDRRNHLVVDQHRLHEACAPVDDAMADRIRLEVVLDRSGCSVDEMPLQARRAGFDGENPQCGQAQPLISGSSSPCSRV